MAHGPRAGLRRLMAVVAAAALPAAALVNLAASPPVAASGPKYTLALIPGLTIDPFYITMDLGAQAAAHKLGIRVLWQGASQWSVSQQTPYVNAMVARHVNGILIAPTDLKEMIPPILNAVHHHIPVLTVDTTISNQKLLISAITSDNAQGGALAARTFARLLHGHGEVAVINTIPGISTTDLRQNGFVQALKKYPHMKLVAAEYDQDSQTTAQTQVEHLLLRYPHLGGIFGTNLYSAVGAAAGVRAAGMANKVKVIGYDAEPLEVQDLKSGLIYALIAQKPFSEGYLGVVYMYDYLTGHHKAIRHSVLLPNVVLTKANLAKNTQWIYKSSTKP